MKSQEIYGGGKGIRTLDPSVANAVLSQLSYAPTGEKLVARVSLLVTGYGSKKQILDSRYWIKLVARCSLLVAGYGSEKQILDTAKKLMLDTG